MPEPDVPDAPIPSGSDLTDAEDEFWKDLQEAERRRKSKLERWRVEDKVVDGEAK